MVEGVNRVAHCEPKARANNPASPTKREKQAIAITGQSVNLKFQAESKIVLAGVSNIALLLNRSPLPRYE